MRLRIEVEEIVGSDLIKLGGMERRISEDNQGIQIKSKF